MSDAMQITTIIPTLCQIERGKTLARAIESIHRASDSLVKILIVVNGQRFDQQLLESMRLRKDVELIQISEGSLIKAHLVGRQAVTTEYFSFLDDDDEYLAGALDIRLAALKENPKADLTVTNGYSFSAGTDRTLYTNMSKVESNPLVELVNENWLHNCNHLFRSASVTEEFFENAHAYMEWTWLAFQLTLGKMSVSAVDRPTFRYYDTQDSLSKSPKFLRSRVDLYRRMLAMTPGREVVRIIRGRLTGAWHDISVQELCQGNRTEAARAHLNSLLSHWTGLKYLSYTRRLL
jgi:glycosyltransferase involved in cell wall biosynthesis